MNGYSILNTTVLLDVMRIMQIPEDDQLEIFDRVRRVDETLTAQDFKNKAEENTKKANIALAKKQQREMVAAATGRRVNTGRGRR